MAVTILAIYGPSEFHMSGLLAVKTLKNVKLFKKSKKNLNCADSIPNKFRL